MPNSGSTAANFAAVAAQAARVFVGCGVMSELQHLAHDEQVACRRAAGRGRRRRAAGRSRTCRRSPGWCSSRRTPRSAAGAVGDDLGLGAQRRVRLGPVDPDVLGLVGHVAPPRRRPRDPASRVARPARAPRVVLTACERCRPGGRGGRAVRLSACPWCGSALAQLNALVGGLAQNVETITRFRAQGATVGADLVVTPELALIGYPPEDLLLREGFVDGERRGPGRAGGRPGTAPDPGRHGRLRGRPGSPWPRRPTRGTSPAPRCAATP